MLILHYMSILFFVLKKRLDTNKETSICSNSKDIY
jgi:hypothetical protein